MIGIPSTRLARFSSPIQRRLKGAFVGEHGQVGGAVPEEPRVPPGGARSRGRSRSRGADPVRNAVGGKRIVVPVQRGLVIAAGDQPRGSLYPCLSDAAESGRARPRRAAAEAALAENRSGAGRFYRQAKGLARRAPLARGQVQRFLAARSDAGQAGAQRPGYGSGSAAEGAGGGGRSRNRPKR